MNDFSALIASMTAGIARVKAEYEVVAAAVREYAAAARTTELQELRASYAEKARLAKEASDAEIAAYKGRIAEIDAELKALDRAEKDDGHFDRVARLSGQLEYEGDEFNRREIEKAIALENEEYEKRKRREALLDEKEQLQAMVKLTAEMYAAQKELYDQQLKERLAIMKAYLDEQERLWAEKLADTRGYGYYYDAAAGLGGVYDDAAGVSGGVVNNNGGGVTVYQTVTTYAKSPAEIAAETREQLENMLKYGLG